MCQTYKNTTKLKHDQAIKKLISSIKGLIVQYWNIVRNYIFIIHTHYEPGTVDSVLAGIVRVYHNNQWGTVCHGGFGMNDAKVACRQLGFTKAVGYWDYGRGSGKVWLSGMGCTGTETSLHSCSHGDWGNVPSGCNAHKWDVGVVCSG